ncbi:hypothetical protein BG003_008252 [Podila horticola]|nr:hypothetical protein BG003_008252 [Podila horticola]
MISIPGTLSVYNPQTRLTMFESGPETSTTSVIFLGGLLDGYHAVPYLPVLGRALAERGVSLIQVMLSSSNIGYGTSSLLQDTQELDILFAFLREERAKTRLFVIGHSTGCQQIIFHSHHGQHKSAVQGIILQGPVSDREFMTSSLDMYGKYLRLAQRMILDGKGQELMIREVDSAPITAYRFSSLAAVGGDDDMFSSDLTLETMQMIYSHIRAPVLWLHSGRDEYVPSHVDKQKLMAQMAAASPTTLATVQLPEADHAISDSASQVLLCQAVLEFVGRVMSDLDAFESSQEASFHGLSL